MQWNKKAEHGRPAEIFEALVKKDVILAPADVPGNGAETGFFHVHFHVGT